MAQKYLNIAKAAEFLGISEDDVKQLQADRRLHGYRDGADWKFKEEDIERLAQERIAQQADVEEVSEGSDILFSEIELGQSDPGASGTVIGLEGEQLSAGDSDIQLGGDSRLASTSQEDEVESKVMQFEELDLGLEDDLTLEASPSGPAPEQPQGGSSIDLGGDLEDDDLVLGGSGQGSDITIGGDSGISLVDPADSGLSLEEPLDLAGSASESLELGDDDVLALEEEGDTDAPAELQADDDFLLTPLEEATDEDESESGSQVIALDAEEEDDSAATMVGGGGMAAMLDEDFAAEPADDLGLGIPTDSAPLGAGPGGLAEGAPVAQGAAAAMLPEMPYSGWNIAGLAACTLMLTFCGMFMYDLLRNMWSWNSAYTVNSSLMDMIIGLFEG